MRWNRLWFVLVAFLLFACTDEEAREQEWIDKTVQEKLDDFRAKKKIDCRESLIQRVLQAADSIMLLESRFDVPDSLNVPEKKSRPDVPAVEFPDYQKPKVIEDSLKQEG